VTTVAPPPDLGSFEVGPELSAAMVPDLEGVNACRTAALSPLLGRRADVLDGIRDEVEFLGVPQELAEDGGLEGVRLIVSEPEQRQRYWDELRHEHSTVAAYGFLLHVLASKQPRESTSAAATLWQALSRRDDNPWISLDVPVTWMEDESAVGAESDGDWASKFQDRYASLARVNGPQIAALAMARAQLARAFASDDDVVKELAGAAFMEGTEDAPVDATSVEQREPSDVEERVSVLVHGTSAWKGDWWRPRHRDFHAYVDTTLGRRPYGAGAQFSWSGRLNKKDRTIAAADLVEWASDRAPAGLWSAFAHSYGGDIVAQAVNDPNNPLALDELVLLSVPVNNEVRNAVKTGLRVVDVRLSFDKVLTIARCHQRVSQRLPNATNVTAVILNKNSRHWRWSHGATHEKTVWVAENIQTLGGF
jgi:hypothetical protein